MAKKTKTKAEKEVENPVHDPYEELERFFKDVTLPDSMILSQCEVISNPKKFIDSHLSIAKRHAGSITYKPYIDRLFFVKDQILKA